MVTTARVTHATPGGAYAHTANRDWESDLDVIKESPGKDPKDCRDVGIQLIEHSESKKLRVSIALISGITFKHYVCIMNNEVLRILLKLTI